MFSVFYLNGPDQDRRLASMGPTPCPRPWLSARTDLTVFFRSEERLPKVTASDTRTLQYLIIHKAVCQQINIHILSSIRRNRRSRLTPYRG